MEEVVVSLGVLPKIFNDEDYKVIIDFFKMLRERIGNVYYSIPRKGIPERFGKYGKKLVEDIEDLGVKETGNRKQLNIVKEEGENSIESFVGNDIRFIKFAERYLKYRIHALTSKLKNTYDEAEKYSLKKKLELYLNAAKRLFKDTYIKDEDVASETKVSGKEKNMNGKLYIHIDFANFFPMEIDWYRLNLWVEFINSLIALIKKELSYKGEHRVIVYLEGYFEPESTKDKERLQNFLKRINIGEENKEKFIEFLKSLFNMLDFKIVIAPKEAEQAIPDIIEKLRRENPGSLHVIVSDDKGRDTTECDLRLVRNKQSKMRVLERGVVRKVISLEDWLDINPLINWFLKKESEVKIVHEESSDLEDRIMAEIESFQLLPDRDKTRVIINMIFLGERNVNRLKEVWNNIDYEIKDKFFSALKDYENKIVKEKILLLLFEIDEDKRGEILSLLKGLLKQSYYELLELVYEKTKKDIEYSTLERRFGEKIKLKEEIEKLRNEIERIKQIAKDEKVTPETKARLEETLRNKQKEYEDLKRTIKRLQEDIEKYTREKENLGNQIQTLNNRKQNLEGEIRRLKGIKSNIEEDIEEKTYQKKRLSEEIKKLEDSISKLKEEINKFEKNKSDKEQKINQLEEEKRKLKSRLEELDRKDSVLYQDIEKLEKEVKYKVRTVESRKKELEKLKEIEETYQKLKRMDELKEFIGSRRMEIKDIEKELKNLEEENKTLKSEYEEILQSRELKEKEINELRENIEKLKDSIEKLEGEVKGLKEKKESIEKMKKQLINKKKSLAEYKKLYGRDLEQKFKKLEQDIDEFISNLP